MNRHTYNTCRLLSFAFIVIISLNCAGSTYADAVRNNETKKHFLWTVETESSTVYLLGSIHVLKKDAYPLPQEIERVYSCCNKVVFETDPGGFNDPDSRAGLMKLGIYPPGQTLSDNISPQTYALLKARLDAAGLPVAQFDQFKPWFVAQTLTGMEFLRLGFDPDLGIDRHFFLKAKEDGKETIFLETKDYQLRLMAQLNKKHQESFLRGVLKELDIIETLAFDMLNAWKTGEVEKLNSILKMSYEEDPQMYDRFILQRNKRWISKIQRLINQGDDVLIIVGAGHLVGKDSVVDLLRKKGHSVNQR